MEVTFEFKPRELGSSVSALYQYDVLPFRLTYLVPTEQRKKKIVIIYIVLGNIKCKEFLKIKYFNVKCGYSCN